MRIGATIGRYEILASLGAGGMGEVYRARDTLLDRAVAVKVLPAEFLEDRGRIERFEREARAVARLSHPNILAIHDFGTSEGIVYAVTELLQGESLEETIARGPVPWHRAVVIATDVAEALAAAHAGGVVHRDLKPANVFLTADGRVKVLDFGLAKLRAPDRGGAFSSAPTEANATLPGVVLGTPGYMSPEQARGEPTDPRTDIFATGCLLYEMLSGRGAFTHANSAEAMAAVLRAEPPPLEIAGAAGDDLTRVVARCLAKRPEDRYPTARALARELRALPSGRSAAAKRNGPARALLRRWILGGAALAVAAALAIAWHSLVGRRPSVGGPTSRKIESLAVLPFENLEADRSQDYFVDGIHEALLTRLAQIRSLRVISRTSVMRFRGSTLPLPEIASELGVDALIEGSVLRDGRRVRINAQLIDGKTDENLWARAYDRDMQDVLGLLDDVARSIAGEVAATVGDASEGDEETRRRVSPDAYDAYLRGQAAFDQPQSADFTQAKRWYERALTLDPDFAEAHAALGSLHVYAGIFGFEPRAVAAREARGEGRKAVEIDPRSAMGHGVLGSVSLYYDLDFDGARRELDRALALDPRMWSVRHAKADLLTALGRAEEGFEETRTGRMDDPLSALANGVYIGHMYFARRFQEVIDEGPSIRARFPSMATFVTSMIGESLWRLGRRDDAVRELLEAWSDDPELTRAVEAARAKGGVDAAAEVVAERFVGLAERGEGTPLKAARALARAGRSDEAIAWLARAMPSMNGVDLLHAVADPTFDAFRGDPRFRDVLRRMGLPRDVIDRASGAADRQEPR